MAKSDLIFANVRFRHWRCFIEVASEKSITKSAVNLGTTQPALSRTLRELEDRLNKKLFERTRDGLILTSAGETLYKYAVGGMSQLTEGLRKLSGSLENEVVKIGALPNMIRVILPNSVFRFKENYPDIHVRVVNTGGIAGLLDQLRSGELDFVVGILADPEVQKGLTFEYLFDEDLIFATAPDHPLRKIKKPTFRDVDPYTILLPVPEALLRRDIDKYLLSIGQIEFSNVVETVSIEFACRYAIEKRGIIVMPRGSIQPDIANGDLVELDFLKKRFVNQIGLISNPGHQRSPQAKYMIEIIRGEIKAL